MLLLLKKTKEKIAVDIFCQLLYTLIGKRFDIQTI